MTGYEEMIEKMARDIYAYAQLLSEQLNRYVVNPDPRYYDFTEPFPDWDKLERTLQKIYVLQAEELLNLKTDKCHLSICKNEPELPKYDDYYKPRAGMVKYEFARRSAWDKGQLRMLDKGFEQTVKK